MSEKYPPSGVMFPVREKSSDRAPDFTGNIEIDADMHKAIGAMLARSDGYAKLAIAGWKRISRNGNEFLSLKASEWRERDDDGSRQSSRPAQEPAKEPKRERKKEAPSFDDLGDEIPF